MPKEPTESEKLYGRLSRHFYDLVMGREKDVGLVIETLENAYQAHDRKKELPPRENLEQLISKAYDGERDRLGEDLPYTFLVDALQVYYWRKSGEDISEAVTTAEAAREFVADVRLCVSRIKKNVQSGYVNLEELESKWKKMEESVLKGLAVIDKMSDDEIIAEARLPYKETEKGKDAFDELKRTVDQTLKGWREVN